MRKTSILVIGLVILIAISGYVFIADGDTVRADNTFAIRMEHTPNQPIRDPAPGNQSVKGDVFRRGDSLATVLGRHNIDAGQVHFIGKTLEKIHPPSKIKCGSEIAVIKDLDSKELIEIQIEMKIDTWASVKKIDGQWVAGTIDKNLFIRVEHKSGEVQNSLWNAARSDGIPPETILDLADMFGWQVDFTSGLRKGDQYNVFYEKNIICDGKTVPGDIIAAGFVNDGASFFGFRQTLKDGSVEYFDDQGQSMRREFLKTPLHYRCISSGFSHRRFHPILKIYRPHLGIDFAAPKGTPVSALGDGVVVFCGRKGGYGKYIQLKHGDAYETCYAHLSGYAKGVKRGARVKQGQVIGYVGSTGLSTGPHLDFRVKYRGSFINPKNIKSEPAAPIPEELYDEFLASRDTWMKRLTN